MTVNDSEICVRWKDDIGYLVLACQVDWPYKTIKSIYNFSRELDRKSVV